MNLIHYKNKTIMGNLNLTIPIKVASSSWTWGPENIPTRSESTQKREKVLDSISRLECHPLILTCSVVSSADRLDPDQILDPRVVENDRVRGWVQPDRIERWNKATGLSNRKLSLYICNQLTVARPLVQWPTFPHRH